MLKNTIALGALLLMSTAVSAQVVEPELGSAGIIAHKTPVKKAEFMMDIKTVMSSLAPAAVEEESSVVEESKTVKVEDTTVVKEPKTVNVEEPTTATEEEYDDSVEESAITKSIINAPSEEDLRNTPRLNPVQKSWGESARDICVSIVSAIGRGISSAAAWVSSFIW